MAKYGPKASEKVNFMSDQRRTFVDKCFKNKAGEVALGQSANLPIIIFVISALIALVVLGNWRVLLMLIAYGSLFTWSWLELFQGINYFRRVLGGFTLIVLIGLTLVYLSSDVIKV